MKKTTGSLQEFLKLVTHQIEKLTPEQREEFKKGVLAQFETRSNELEAQPHPNDFSSLHAELATYCGELVRSASYRKLEKRFLLRMREKKDKGLELSAEEKGLLDKIRFCSKCGTKNPRGSVYCFNCGQKQNPPANRFLLTDFEE
jgi:ribosomal protein L40E